MNRNKVDVKENDIYYFDIELLDILLKDNSSGKNLIWATDNYASHGCGYQSFDYITVQSVTEYNGNVIKPRIEKSKKEQAERIKQKAEVFTPSWICNKQNNLVDNAWFGEDFVFNTESEKTWTATKRKIPFPTPTGKTWQDYVSDTRLEITCGEAPYLVSRYDTVSGKYIDVESRIGLLDRKLRVVSENTNSEDDWLNWVIIAFQNIYGFDWYGDNVFLTRENLLFTFADYYKAKFGKSTTIDMMRKIADILSWNIWQMDGLKYVIPDSCRELEELQLSFFGNQTINEPCPGCTKNDPYSHIGIYCKIKDWKVNKTVKFVSLLKKNIPTVTEEDEKMQFDVVVGNPPYQENIGTAGVNDSLGKQLFPSFMKAATALSAKYSSMIVPSKWFTGKAQDGSFISLRDFVAQNNHFQHIINYLNGRDVFPDVSTGSVMYYLYNKDYTGDVTFSNRQNGNISTMQRPLFENGVDIVIPMNNTISILQKVKSTEFESIESMVTGRNPFGVPATNSTLMRKTVVEEDASHPIKILCAYEEIRFIAKDEIIRNLDLLDKWKVFTAKINGGAGTILDGKPVLVLGKTFVMGENTACSNTLLAIGSFNTKQEADNLNSYMKTKFFRFMLGIKKNANVLTSNIYSFVPVQDFSKSWTDSELYDKYGLTPDEIAFIESTIKPMK